MPLITTANARELAARSQEARRRNTAARKLAALNPVIVQPVAPPVAPQSPPNGGYVNGTACDDPFARELVRAMDETLQELRDAENAKDRAACAQALRNLRETYHLVTGQPRPGVSKPGKARQPATWSGLSIEPAPVPADLHLDSSQNTQSEASS